MIITLIGNCQATPLADIIRSVVSEKIIIDVLPVNQLKKEDEYNTVNRIKRSDVIVTQPIQHTYHLDFLRTNNIKNYFQKDIVTIPNLFFRGYTPDLAYITVNKKRVQSPIGDYNHRVIFENWKNKTSLSELESLLTIDDVEARHRECFTTASSSLNDLNVRERDLTITISEYIKKHWTDKRLFYTFNHPTTHLLSILSKYIINHLNLRRVKFPELFLYGEPLNKVIPLSYNSYVDGISFKFSMPRSCRGQEFSLENNILSLKNIPKIYNISSYLKNAYLMYDHQFEGVDLYSVRIS